MLLFLLCPAGGVDILSITVPVTADLINPLAVLFEPCGLVGDSSDMGLAAVLPVRCALAVSSRGAGVCTS